MPKSCKLFSLTLLLVLVAGVQLLVAQTTGKIEGVVTDKDSGSPMSGVQVTVEGTRLGNVTNEDGYYFILNVPVGLRKIDFTFTGYQPFSVNNVRITAGNTITVNGMMSSQVIGLEAIVVEGEAEPLMTRDNVQTRQNMDSRMITELPSENIQDLLVLQAGVVVDYSGNYSLRGGREGEEALYVDGVLARSQNEQQGTEDRGSVDTDAGGVINPLVVATDAMEEVSLITGGFQAEFGNAQSGMINIVTKEGGTNFTGRIAFTTDEMNPESMNYGYNQLEGNVGGPVVSDKLSFFASGMMKGMEDAFPRLSGDKGGFRGVDQRFIDMVNRDLGTIGVVSDGISDRGDAIDPLSVNSFADLEWVTSAPTIGYGVVNDDGSVTRGFTRTDGVAFGVLQMPTYVADPSDVVDGMLREGAQPLIQVDPTNGNLFVIGDDGLATSSPDAIQAAFDNGVVVANPDYKGAYQNANEAQLPGNWKDTYTLSFKTTYSPVQPMKFIGVYHESRNQRMFYDHSYMFNRPERRNQAQKLNTSLGIVGLDWEMVQNSERSLTMQSRLSFFDNSLDGGELLAEDALDRNTFLGVGGEIDFYGENETNRYMLYSGVSNAGYANDLLEPSSLVPDIEKSQQWPTDQVSTHNIFGTTTPSRRGERGNRFYPSQFITNGMALPLRNDDEERVGFKVDFDSQFDRYNRIKFGLEYMSWDQRETTRFYYGEFTDDEWTAKPRMLSLYGQDRIDLGDLVIDLGLRYDRFDVNKDVPVIIGQNNPDFDDAMVQPEAEGHWSPRIGVAHPVTDRTQVRLSYGHFYQIPAFEILYAMSERDFMTDALSNPNQTFGNPWLGMGKTIQFEAGFTALLSDDLVLDFVGYNRDISGNFGYRLASADDLRNLGGVASDYVVRGQGNLRIPANQDNGNVRGFDLTLDKRYNKYIGARLTYSLMFARSTQSDPQEYVRTLARQLDPFTNQSPAPPSDLAPTDNDRTHQVSLMLNSRFPGDFMEGTAAGKIFRDFGANFTIRFATGVPYTPIDDQGDFITTSNSARTPSFTQADLRLQKSFVLSSQRITAYVSIINLFENENYAQQGIDPTSGQVGIDKYFLGEIISSALSTQVTTEQDYIRDFNKDGFVSTSEAAAATFAKGRATDLNPTFWLLPREVRLGLEYSF